MPYRMFHAVLPEVAAKETRVLAVASSEDRDDALPVGAYVLYEMYCDEAGCDCRRVMFHVEASFRPGPEAVIAWGWERQEFYVRWLGEDDEATLDELKGPALNSACHQTELADALLAAVRRLLSWDDEYKALIQAHYRQFRDRVDPTRSARTPNSMSSRCVASGGLLTRASVADALKDAGILTTDDYELPSVALLVDDTGRPAAPGDALIVTDGENCASVELPAIRDLYVGDCRPPQFGAQPPPEYAPFFLSIERAAHDYYVLSGGQVRDKEYERAYNDLRRRPDSGGPPLLLHLRSAVRLYMAIRDVSPLEFEGVLGRLSRSARTFAMGHTSTNYFDHALLPVFGGAP